MQNFTNELTQQASEFECPMCLDLLNDPVRGQAFQTKASIIGQTLSSIFSFVRFSKMIKFATQLGQHDLRPSFLSRLY